MTTAIDNTTKSTIASLATCIDCGRMLGGRSSFDAGETAAPQGSFAATAAHHCSECMRSYPIRDGILEAIGPLDGRNRIVANFYDGPGWPKFRKWERLFLSCQGGARRARLSILKHVLAIGRPDARVLEVGIGDGENIPYLPETWSIYGVDIARTQLVAGQKRFPQLRDHLAWAQAERLPFPDGTFDACYSVGGFSHYGDQAAALREMRRVTRTGGTVVVADESPKLHRLGIGHLIGVPSIDAAWLRFLGLDREFVDMVLSLDFDIHSLADSVLPGSRIIPIWSRLGYCLIHRDSPSLPANRN